MSHQYHFRSTVEKQRMEQRAEARGCQSVAEYIRLCIREEMQRDMAEASR